MKYQTLWCVTMIDPATSWFEMKQIKNKTAFEVATAVEQTWLTRYPWPRTLTYDRGTEFMAEFSKMIKDDYGIKRRPTTSKNPQANAILERIHQVIGNMIKTFEVYNREDLDQEDPWSGMLITIMFGLRSTFYSTLKATPMQLVYGRDAILPIFHQADWKYIKDTKQKMIDINNKRENSKRINYEYKINDQVMIKRSKKTKHGEREYDGPYPITQVNNNGTIRIQKEQYSDVVNIRRVFPYHQ